MFCTFIYNKQLHSDRKDYLFVNEFSKVWTYVSEQWNEITVNFSLLLKVQLIQTFACTLHNINVKQQLPHKHPQQQPANTAIKIRSSTFIANRANVELNQFKKNYQSIHR